MSKHFLLGCIIIPYVVLDYLTMHTKSLILSNNLLIADVQYIKRLFTQNCVIYSLSSCSKPV